MQNLDLSDYLLIDYPNFKTSGCLYYNIPKKKFIFWSFLFSLVRNRTNRKNFG